MNESDYKKGSLEDYLAEMNLGKGRRIWKDRRERIHNLFKRVQKEVDRNMEICEIGIGEGYLLKLLYLKGYRNLTGIDISNYLIEKLSEEFEKKNYKITLINQDISNPLEISKKFDIIICLDILEHIKAIDDALENIYKILKEGGLLLFTLPWNEDIINNMVMCPYCKKQFHPIGHFHSFSSMKDIQTILKDKFQIMETKFCKPINLDLINQIFHYLKMTIFRPVYYKKGKPKYPSTIFLKARKYTLKEGT